MVHVVHDATLSACCSVVFWPLGPVATEPPRVLRVQSLWFTSQEAPLRTSERDMTVPPSSPMLCLVFCEVEDQHTSVRRVNSMAPPCQIELHQLQRQRVDEHRACRWIETGGLDSRIRSSCSPLPSSLRMDETQPLFDDVQLPAEEAAAEEPPAERLVGALVVLGEREHGPYRLYIGANLIGRQEQDPAKADQRLHDLGRELGGAPVHGKWGSGAGPKPRC